MALGMIQLKRLQRLFLGMEDKVKILGKELLVAASEARLR
jgi:hypothetical protein